MPEVVKYGRCEPQNMEIAFEALRNGDIGLNAASLPHPLRKYTQRDTQVGKIILLWKTFKLLSKGNWLPVLQLEQYMLCTTITYLRSLVFKFGELNQFSYAPNQERCRWNEMILWVHETTLTTKFGAATCQAKFGAAGFSKDSVCEVFNLHERTAEHKVNGIITDVCNVNDNALTT